MKLRPDQPIHERVRILEEVLAIVLDRDGSMQVEPFEGDADKRLCVWVIEKPYDEVRTGHDLHQLAKEMEVLLS